MGCQRGISLERLATQIFDYLYGKSIPLSHVFDYDFDWGSSTFNHVANLVSVPWSNGLLAIVSIHVVQSRCSSASCNRASSPQKPCERLCLQIQRDKDSLDRGHSYTAY